MKTLLANLGLVAAIVAGSAVSARSQTTVPSGRAKAGAVAATEASPRLDPAAESNAINEAQRQFWIGRQIDLNARMAWSANLAPVYPSPFGTAGLWTYPRAPVVSQPVGHESRQVGPNRWTYRPLYAAPILPFNAGPIHAGAVAGEPLDDDAPLPATNQRPQPQELPRPSEVIDDVGPATRPAPTRPVAPPQGPREF